MLVWLLFIGDFLSMIAILGMQYEFIPGWRFPLICILYLGIKGAMFFGDMLSVLDVIIALYMLLMLIFNVTWFLTYIALGVLAYKLIVTLVYSIGSEAG